MSPPDEEFIKVPKIGDYIIPPAKCPKEWGAVCSCVQRDMTEGGTCLKLKIIYFKWLREEKK